MDVWAIILIQIGKSPSLDIKAMGIFKSMFLKLFIIKSLFRFVPYSMHIVILIVFYHIFAIILIVFLDIAIIS